MNSNTQARLAYEAAAEEIQYLINRLGFSSDLPVDGATLKKDIAEIIRQNIEGNVYCVQVDPTDDFMNIL